MANFIEIHSDKERTQHIIVNLDFVQRVAISPTSEKVTFDYGGGCTIDGYLNDSEKQALMVKLGLSD